MEASRAAVEAEASCQQLRSWFRAAALPEKPDSRRLTAIRALFAEQIAASERDAAEPAAAGAVVAVDDSEHGVLHVHFVRAGQLGVLHVFDGDVDTSAVRCDCSTAALLPCPPLNEVLKDKTTAEQVVACILAVLRGDE
eukprot:PLAT811.1.p1 GENE.PLAT811.1~~PLAT811.1.p1  ORF type:complete len:162 (-),score=36.44 PLAT811.1:437-853(-)